MLTYESLFIFVPTITLLVMLPGPDFAYITKVSLFNGKKSAYLAAIGVTCGMCFHTILAMLGLSAIVATSSFVFNIIKYAGAIYLFYIGIIEVRNSFKLKNNNELNRDEIKFNIKKSSNKYLYSGFLINILNPKVILYFLVLYPQFINQNSSITLQFIEMGVITAVVCFIWFIALACIFDKIKYFFTNILWQKWLMRFTGLIFISFGLKLVTQKID